jgi:hypothetical protein
VGSGCAAVQTGTSILPALDHDRVAVIELKSPGDGLLELGRRVQLGHCDLLPDRDLQGKRAWRGAAAIWWAPLYETAVLKR